MSKRILKISSAKLTAISIGLLLAVFCTIGMSFRPVYDENEAAEIVMSGQKRAHWDNKSTDSCTGAETHRYNSTVDKANTNVQTRGNGSVAISTSETANVTSPASGSPRTVTSGTAAGNTATISWNSGLATESNASSPTYTNEQITVAHKKAFTISATPSDPDEYYFAGWGTTTAESSIDNNDNPRNIVSDMKITGYTEGSKGNPDYSSTAYSETYYAFFKPRVAVTITLKPNANGTISYSYKNVPTTTISAETTFTTKYDVALTATPADGYKFFGWYTLSGSTENYISYANPNTRAYKENVTLYAKFVPTNQAIFNIKGTEQYYCDLNHACSEAASSTSKIVYPINDGVVPAGNCTIPSGVTLLIPYNSGNNTQTEPAIVRSEAAVVPFRMLTLSEGTNIVCNNGAAICLGGQIMSAGGGNPTGYTTGPCGVLDMSRGGHIELNSGSTLYAWGFVKGQDMDQGNNTVGVGTITANSGSAVWENLAFGDWRGGSACLAIADTRFFPFQSYFPQNIEVPLLIKNGASDNCYSVVYANSSNYPVSATMIGSSGALFKTSTGGEVRKWYDPTTDLICYELSGTANLDAITVSGLPMIGSISSSSFDLPISSNMHIILTNSSVTLSKPMVVQPGAKIEIKNDANITLNNNLYMYDKDDWGLYVVSRYFRNYGNTFGILTSHKYRGDGTSKELLDDAQLIVDGTLTIGSSGRLYATAGGADIMGNDGHIIFPGTLAGSSALDAVTGNGDKSGQVVEDAVAVNTANLHNENSSYTKVESNKTFHNVLGRWFVDGKEGEKTDHTYDFTYISSGDVNGTGGTSTTTDAVYSWDKTGVELQQKWANVTHVVDLTCPWWQGQGEQATWFYNWTLNSAWHQFIPTTTDGLYSSSTNQLYTKSDCTWEPFGSTDINCLYEIGGVKKALVEGQFIALEANHNDPAYHAANDATQYYICFEGCNWHAATKVDGKQKAYTVDGDDYIWYNGAWMKAELEDPFYFTYDATNVKIYYEYIGSDWVIALPYVEVIDAFETRSLLTFNEAVAVASSKTDATIRILRDIPNVITSGVFKGAGRTCTLDLNGHVVTSSCSNLLNINASGSTFIITDNTTEKKGELRACPEGGNARTIGFTVTAGTLKLEAGKMYSTNTTTRTGSTDATFTKATNTGVVVKAGAVFTVTGGMVESEDEHQPYAVTVETSGTMNLSGTGRVRVYASKWYSTRGVSVANGTFNMSGGTVESSAAGSEVAYGVYVNASASYNADKNTTSKSHGTLNLSGGSIIAESPKNACGVYVVRAFAVQSATNRTIKAEDLGVVKMTGGTITANATTSTSAKGISSYGTVTVSNGTITANVLKSDQSTAYGVLVYHGNTTISGTTNITANAPTKAYGVWATADVNTTYGILHQSNVTIENGTVTANATKSTIAYAVYVNGNTKNLASGNFTGDYGYAGTVTINNGTFNSNVMTNTAAGVYVVGTKTLNDATASPKCTINNGKFKMTGTATLNGVVGEAATTSANFQINGGYYSHDGNLATYVPSPKHVLTLASGDANRPPYYYKVAEAYLVTFKTEDGSANIIDPVYQEVGTQPICSTEPTKASTTTNSFTFDGWATEANGTKVYEPNGLPNVTSAGATYYAHFATTTLKYRVHFDAATNGGECATENIYVNPSSAISTEIATLPTATKYGYTFNGWYTAASSGTKITTATVPTADVTYYAQFTVNSHTLTWDLAGGTVSTAGKIGSTTWPAKNATGTQSRSVAYGTVLTTIPVVTRTGYTFNRWDPVPGSSMPDADVTYTAIWTPKTNTAYTVKHYQQNVDGTYPTDPFETEAFTGTTATSVTPAVKSYEGFVSPATQTVTIAANGSTAVTYQYARRHYTFTLDATTNGGTSDETSIEVIHGATIGTVPPDAQKGCNDFIGWFTKAAGGVKITSDFVIEYDMKTLYSQFSNDVRTYPITYLAGENGTGTVAAGTKTCGVDMVLSSSTFTRPGYTQTGWSTTDGGVKAYDLGGAYTTNAALTLYPFWTINTHALNWNFDGGTPSGSYTEAGNAIPYGTTITYPTVTKTGYTFGSWSTSVTSMPDNDLTITASWNIVTYNLTYDGLEGATNSNPATYTIETPTITLADPGARAGYNFTGWTCGGSPITQITLGSTGNKTITANWELVGYQINFVDEDGTTTLGDYPKTLNPGATVTAPTEPTKAQTAEYTYTFAGWFDGTNTYASDAIPNVTAAATYTATYTATPNVASVKVGSSTTYYTTLPLAFAYAADKTTPTIKVLADIALAAKVTYTNTSKTTVTIDLNGHTVSGALNPLLTLTSATSTGGLIVIKSSVEGGQIRNVVNSNAARACVVLSKGKLRFESGKIYMENKSTSSSVQAYGIQVSSSRTFTMIGGTVEVKSAKHAYAIYSAGTTNIEGGELIVTETKNGYAAGVHVITGTATISENPTITVSGTKYVNGVRVGGLTPAINSGKTAVTMYNGVANIEGGNYTVTASTNTAYGVYCYGNTFKVDYATNATLAGNYANGGTANISGGEFSVTSNGATAYGVCMQTPTTIQTALDADGNATYDAATTHPKANITGGKFDVSGTSSVGAVNTVVPNTDLVVEGGWYNINTNLAGYVAPEKSCNYWVLPLSDATYHYEVAEAYKVTWDATTNGGSCGTEYTVVKNGAAIGTLPEATKTNYSFDGWYTAAAGGTTVTTTTTISATQTYYAQFTPDSYTVTLNTNGGTINAGEVTSYTYGTGATLPTDVTKDGHTFGGWFDNSGLTGDAVTTISSTATGNKEFWAKWTAATQTYEYYDESEGAWVSVSAASAPTPAASYDDEDYHYVYDGYYEDLGGGTYRAHYSSSEREYGTPLDIVDWTANKIVVNANGLKANEGGTAWQIKYNGGYDYNKDSRTTDRRLLITRNSETPDSYIVLKLKGTDGVERRNKYLVPHIYDASNNLSGTEEKSVVYVHTGATLTVNASTTIKDLYISPGANVVVANGNTLTITGKLVLRTLPWQSATIEGNVLAAQTFYTRIGPNGLEIDGRNGKTTYASAPYYQLALPYDCNIADVRLSDGSTPVYNKVWILKSYSEAGRAANGAAVNNWVAVTNAGTDTKIKANTGYEFFSNTAYYREFYFPVTPAENTTVTLTRTGDDAANSGWNMICSPLMSNHAKNPHPEDVTVSWLNEDGQYDQSMPEIIPPAIPFFYQASQDNEQISFAGTNVSPSLAPRRVAAAQEPTRIQWIRLDVKDANGEGDETSIYSHPTRYEQYYQTGIDVAKQSLTATRARLYSSHAYGDMAFAGVSDELLEQGVALTLYSPAEQALTFSLRQNDWLNRMEYVWIIDVETGAMIDLLSSDYTAEVTQGTTYGRFYISGRFRAPQIATDIDATSDSSLNGKEVHKVLIEQKMYIMVGDKLYDSTGKLVK